MHTNAHDLKSLTTGSNRSLRSLGLAKASPLTKRYVGIIVNLKRIIQNSLYEFKANFYGLLLATGPYIAGSVVFTALVEKYLAGVNGYTVDFLTYFIKLALESLVTLIGLRYLFRVNGSAIKITNTTVLTYCFATAYISVAAGIGFVLLLIPGLLIMAISFLYPIFIIKQDHGPIQSITSSIDLIKGNTAKVLIIYCGSSLLFILATYLFSLLIESTKLPASTASIITDILTQIIYLYYIPLMIIIYSDLTTKNNENKATSEPSISLNT